jgi:hypothetical protein
MELRKLSRIVTGQGRWKLSPICIASKNNDVLEFYVGHRYAAFENNGHSQFLVVRVGILQILISEEYIGEPNRFYRGKFVLALL